MFCLVTYILTQLITYELFYVALVMINYLKEKYLEMTLGMMGKDYADALENLITYPHMALVALGAFIGGIIGAYIGKALLKKHFEKAGIV